MRSRWPFGFWFPLVVACVAAGCSGEKVPRLGRVTGTVTLDGTPVPDASVIFGGAKPGESPSLGKTDASGTYELYYSRGHKGATIGEHPVYISSDASGTYELYYSRGHKGATIGEHPVYISTYQGKTDENPQAKKETIP